MALLLLLLLSLSNSIVEYLITIHTLSLSPLFPSINWQINFKIGKN